MSHEPTGPASDAVGPRKLELSTEKVEDVSGAATADGAALTPNEKAATPTQEFFSESTERPIPSSRLTIAQSRRETSKNVGNLEISIISRLSDHWAFEILSCVLACACLGLIAGIQARYQNKALPEWPSLISINTIVAVGSTVLKDALRVPVAEAISQLKWLYFHRSHPLSHFEDFDGASRGPWNAFLFLFSKHKRYLASMGALISVLILAIDPFAQQVIQYYSCLEPTAGQARISRTNNYTTGGFQTQALFAEPDGPMAAALYLGTLNPPKTVTETITFECGTGNCTFPSSEADGASVTSLAICSFCKEAPDKIEFNETSGVWYTAPWGEESGCQVGEVYPDSPDLPYQLLHVTKVLANEDAFDEFITLQFLTLNVDETCDTSSGNTTTCRKHPWVAECSLYACVKTYKSTIEHNKLEETELKEIPLRQTNVSAQEVTTTENLTWSLAVSDVLDRGIYRECLLSPTPTAQTPVAISRNNTLQSGQDPNDTYTVYTEPSCVYVLGFTTALALNQLLSVMFDASPLGAPREDTINTQGDTWLRNFYRNGTVTISSASEYFEAMASTMTGLVREYGDSSREENWAMGTPLALQTCVRIKWGWFVYPVLIVALTMVFMGLTFLRCVAKGVWRGAWRSSAIAVCFVRKDGLPEVEQSARRGRIEAMADHISMSIGGSR